MLPNHSLGIEPII